MSSFDIPALLEVLDDVAADLALVTLRLEDAPEVTAGAQAEGRYLDLDAPLARRFRTGLRRSLAAVRRHPVDDYEAGWVNLDDHLADADAAELTGPVLPAVRDAMRRSVEPDFSAAREQADAESAPAGALPPIGAYAVVVRRPSGPSPIFLRRRDPVERLTRSQFTARLSRTRLTTMDDVFVFDSGFDLVAWGDRALIKSSSAFEALFLNDTVRRAGALRAAATLGRQIPIANPGALDDVIRADSRFAGRLRAIERRGQLERLDRDAVERATKRFEIDHRMLRAGQLVFLPRWRFIWLAALEDSLVESAGTGRLSIARITSEWKRRLVTCVERDPQGRVTALVGEWGRAEARDAVRRLRTGSETYYAAPAGARAEIDFDEASGAPLLIAQVGDDPTDRMAEIPGCAAS